MLRVLVLTGGHPFDRPSFTDMLDALPDVWWEEVAHPEAQARLAPGASVPTWCWPTTCRA